eukprot:356044-Chlamydomonas_euryale.AAC.3
MSRLVWNWMDGWMCEAVVWGLGLSLQLAHSVVTSMVSGGRGGTACAGGLEASCQEQGCAECGRLVLNVDVWC